MSKQANSTPHAARRPTRASPHFETDESWAVSYSDFLMVLMSFFIIYFNINESESSKATSFDNVILKLSQSSELELKGAPVLTQASQSSGSKLSVQFKLLESKLAGTSGIVTKDNREIDRTLASRKEDGLVSSLAGGFVNDKQEKEVSPVNIPRSIEITIDLSENLFPVGNYDLNQQVKQELNKVFSVIEEAKDSMNIIFIGHTDKVKYKNSSKRVVNSNLILSSMRAAKAVEYAIKKGFDGNQVFVQGLNNQPRNSRSLSVRLVEK